MPNLLNLACSLCAEVSLSPWCAFVFSTRSQPAGQAVPGNASGSDEYLMVDQRENTFNGPTVVCQPQVPLPVSSMPQAAMAGRVPRRPPDSSELDDVPLRDLQGALRAWSGFSRQHSSSQGRPPLHPAQPSEEHAAEAQVLTSLLDSGRHACDARSAQMRAPGCNPPLSI